MKNFVLSTIAAICLYGQSFSQYNVDINRDKPVDLSPLEKERLENSQIGNCQFVPVYNFQPGMKFYFPRDDYKEKEDYPIPAYYLAKEAQKKEYKRTKLQYKDLAGKLFAIAKMEDRKDDFMAEGFITLKQIDGDLVIEFKSNIGLATLRENAKKDNAYDRVVILKYAIYIPDIDTFKSKFEGKELYTKFPVAGRKFNKVKIVLIGAGTEDAPIRVVVQDAAGNQEQKDICTCGTNTVRGLSDFYLFTKLFQEIDPKKGYTGSEEVWDLICQNKVKIGMSKDDLLLAWGKPQRINQSVSAGLSTEQWVYSSSQYVYLENGKIRSFQNSK